MRQAEKYSLPFYVELKSQLVNKIDGTETETW
jgi:hypothetical protein